MIEITKGDILRADVDALVNTVNCVGVSGRGIALQFREAFPENFKAYAGACKHRQVQPGRMFVFETDRLSNPSYIINFPTKRHWRGKSRIEDIERGLEDLVRRRTAPRLESGNFAGDLPLSRHASPRDERTISGVSTFVSSGTCDVATDIVRRSAFAAIPITDLSMKSPPPDSTVPRTTAACCGDCDGSSNVTVDEIVTTVDKALHGCAR